MDRIAIFVDAGYLYAAGSKLITGANQPRKSLALDFKAIRELLIAKSKEVEPSPLLRMYWYDGTVTGPTAQHKVIANLPEVKLRLGMINSEGQQKGVDSLIVTDLINLARNRSITSALLVSGDEDVRVGVQQAQEFGVRVHLLGISPSAANQSNLLRQESDTVSTLTKNDLSKILSTVDENVLSDESGLPTTLEGIANALAASLSNEERGQVALDGNSGVPREFDGSLLVNGAKVLNKDSLNSSEKREIRAAFVTACKGG